MPCPPEAWGICRVKSSITCWAGVPSMRSSVDSAGGFMTRIATMTAISPTHPPMNRNG
ncbi:Uncharacterised protein [Mycobacteroides abscessus subsp. abscessus]|nr:Uncharacterised protein [Mycobacteroides abscessus subsp. abscessus]